MKELLTRRFGPAPLWLWFVVFVFGVAIFLRWRAAKRATNPDAETTTATTNQSVFNSPFVTGQSAGLPWSQDIFVNVQKGAGDGPRRHYRHRHDDPTPPTTNPPPPVTNPPPPPQQQSMTYQVKPGDTLSSIAYTFGYRNPDGSLAWKVLYDANASLIEAVARQHGFASSDTGHWIFGDTVLTLPG